MSIALATVAIGCRGGDSKRETVLVTGTVTKADGELLKRGEIVFTPVESGPTVNSAGGNIDANGRYELTTYEPGDGCVPGTYRIGINIWGMSIPNMDAPPGTYEIPPRYINGRTSGLEVEVVGGQESQEINLQLESE